MIYIADVELLRKHAKVVKDALAEARVKSYTRRSKTGKQVVVKDFERRDNLRKQKMRDMDKVKAHHKNLGPDPMSPGQLKKKHGKDIFNGNRHAAQGTAAGQKGMGYDSFKGDPFASANSETKKMLGPKGLKDYKRKSKIQARRNKIDSKRHPDKWYQK